MIEGILIDKRHKQAKDAAAILQMTCDFEIEKNGSEYKFHSTNTELIERYCDAMPYLRNLPHFLLEPKTNMASRLTGMNYARDVSDTLRPFVFEASTHQLSMVICSPSYVNFILTVLPNTKIKGPKSVYQVQPKKFAEYAGPGALAENVRSELKSFASYSDGLAVLDLLNGQRIVLARKTL